MIIRRRSRVCQLSVSTWVVGLVVRLLQSGSVVLNSFKMIYFGALFQLKAHVWPEEEAARRAMDRARRSMEEELYRKLDEDGGNNDIQDGTG